jgi:hypothetical protein
VVGSPPFSTFGTIDPFAPRTATAPPNSFVDPFASVASNYALPQPSTFGTVHPFSPTAPNHTLNASQGIVDPFASRTAAAANNATFAFHPPAAAPAANPLGNGGPPRMLSNYVPCQSRSAPAWVQFGAPGAAQVVVSLGSDDAMAHPGHNVAVHQAATSRETYRRSF